MHRRGVQVLDAMLALVDRAQIRSARATLCGPQNCLEGLA